MYASGSHALTQVVNGQEQFSNVGCCCLYVKHLYCVDKLNTMLGDYQNEYPLVIAQGCGNHA